MLVSLVLIRSINKPLKELVEKSIKGGQGDHAIHFASVKI